jgi:hypothetical protein
MGVPWVSEIRRARNHLDGRRIAYIKIDDKIRSKIRNKVAEYLIVEEG